MNAPARRQWRGHPIVGRSAWTLAGQAASSSSNFLLSLCVLASANRAEFASFSVAVMGFLFVTQLSRSAFSMPVLMLYSEDGVKSAKRSGAAVAASVATGVAGAVAFILAGLAFEPGRTQLFLFAASLPFLQYQDAIRHVAFARGEPKAAAQSDLLWVGLQILGTAVAAATGWASPSTLVAIWAVAGSGSGILFGTRLGVVPEFHSCRRWLRENRPLCTRLATEFLLYSGSYYALGYGLVALAGADQLGRWRAAQALIGPVSVLLMGGTALGVPESVRVRERPGSLWKFAGVLSGGLATVAALGGILMYVVLPTVGPALFPDTWETARPVLPVLTLFAVAVGASTGAVAALRASDQSRWLMAARGASGAAALAIGLTLAGRWGAEGALTGLTVAEAAFCAAAWLRLRRTVARPAVTA